MLWKFGWFLCTSYSVLPLSCAMSTNHFIIKKKPIEKYKTKTALSCQDPALTAPAPIAKWVLNDEECVPVKGWRSLIGNTQRLCIQI